jgi:hypothetical protein
MNSGFKVEYSDDKNEVCVIPYPLIPVEDFVELVNMFMKLGYKSWLPADERRGYIFSKKRKKNEI